MAKDPAFLFYPDNFMSGTMFMSDEQVGKYIRLICAQHLTGHLTEKDMLMICKTKDEDIWNKFRLDTAGKFFNERLEIETNKRKAFSESRSKNRKGKKKEVLKKSITSDKHLGNGNENGNKDGIEERKLKFFTAASIYRNEYKEETLNAFCEYWTEHNEGGQKMRFEMEKVFDKAKRLKTWVSREKNFKSNGKSDSENKRAGLDAYQAAAQRVLAGGKTKGDL